MANYLVVYLQIGKARFSDPSAYLLKGELKEVINSINRTFLTTQFPTEAWIYEFASDKVDARYGPAGAKGTPLNRLLMLSDNTPMEKVFEELSRRLHTHPASKEGKLELIDWMSEQLQKEREMIENAPQPLRSEEEEIAIREKHGIVEDSMTERNKLPLAPTTTEERNKQ